MVVIDFHTHFFNVCPWCRGLVLVIRVPEEEIDEAMIKDIQDMNNRGQVRELIEYCDLNDIPVADIERMAA